MSTVPTSGVPLSQRLRQRLATTIAEQEKQVEAKQQSGKVAKLSGCQVSPSESSLQVSPSESTARLCLVVLCNCQVVSGCVVPGRANRSPEADRKELKKLHL